MYALFSNALRSSRIRLLMTVGSSSTPLTTGRVFTEAKSASSSITRVGVSGIRSSGPTGLSDFAQRVRLRRTEPFFFTTMITGSPPNLTLNWLATLRLKSPVSSAFVDGMARSSGSPAKVPTPTRLFVESRARFSRVSHPRKPSSNRSWVWARRLLVVPVRTTMNL